MVMKMAYGKVKLLKTLFTPIHRIKQDRKRAKRLTEASWIWVPNGSGLRGLGIQALTSLGVADLGV